jgi:four helix bundle protein
MENSVGNFNDKFRERTRALAMSICNWADQLPRKDSIFHLKGQIIRSSASVAANFSAACRARSSQEYYSKICIVVEECDETLFWLSFLTEMHSLGNDKTTLIQKETSELLAVFSVTRKTLKLKHKS